MRLPPAPPVWDRAWGRELVRALVQAEIDRELVSSLVWSPAARPTRQRWIDGRALWALVVPLTRAFLESDGATIPHGIAGVRDFVRISGVWVNDGVAAMLPWQGAGVTLGFSVTATALVAAVTGTANWPLFERGHVLLEYTAP